MNLKDKIIESAVNKIIQLAPNNKIFSEYHNRTQRKRLGYDRQAISMQTKTLSDWKFALIAATDPLNPHRGDLMRFYKNNLMLDDHLGSVIETRSLAVQQASFIVVDKNDKENEKLKELLQREWMLDLMDKHVGSIFQGTTLVELYETNRLTGELLQIDEIPQSNFIAPKGLHLQREYDRAGCDYKSPAYAPYYAQIGRDWNMGMLNVLTPIVLAKKLGLGSWLSYIDKFGVPPIFAITERMDTARRDELFDMLENFRQNHFAVLQGKETIQIPANYNVDAYATFEALHNLGDKNISKRVLGQTGTTDEKSFVGSAKIHEKVAKSRHEADKLRFTYFFNNEIRWRLVKLGAAYSDFESHTIKFDNGESLDTTGYIDGVSKLSQYYTFDTGEIAQKTGLPITGTKEFIGFTAIPSEQEQKQEQKTKATLNPAVYGAKPKMTIPDSTTITAVTAIDLSGWEKTMETIYNDIYNGKIKATDITPEYVKKLNGTLRDALEKGLNKKLNTIQYDSKDYETLQALQQNIFKFSCAKNFNMQQRINNLLVDENGNRRNFNAFEKEVKKLGVEYNQNYLKTEWGTATNSARSVRDWEYYKSIADVYPNLQVMPTSAKEPREDHKHLEGMTLPINHTWWQQNGLPPWDWNCMHRVEPVQGDADENAPKVAINPIFANNVAESGEIFNGKHPYFAMNSQLFEELQQGTELAKEYADYNKLYDGVKGKVLGSVFADKSDLEGNLKTAKIIADNLKETIRIRPHINVNGLKNPEYLIRNEFADRKAIKGIDKGINNAIKASNKQGCSRVVIDFNQNQIAMDIPKLAAELKNAIKPNINKLVKEVYVVYGEKVVKVTRKEIYGDMLTDLLKKITDK